MEVLRHSTNLVNENLIWYATSYYQESLQKYYSSFKKKNVYIQLITPCMLVNK